MATSANAAASPGHGRADEPIGLDKIVESIGPKIRELRLEQKLSLQQLAVRAEVSAAAIHKVERNDMVPTITTLLKVASALGRPIGYFVDDAASNRPIAEHSRGADRTPLPGGPEGTETYPVAAAAGRFQLGGAVTVIEPGASGGAEPTRTSGEELVYVLDGTLDVEVGDERYTLVKTDSLRYPTEYPRRWTSKGRKPARALWVSLSAHGGALGR